MALDNVPSSSLASEEGWDADRLFGDLSQDPAMHSLLYADEDQALDSRPDASRTQEACSDVDDSRWRFVTTIDVVLLRR